MRCRKAGVHRGAVVLFAAVAAAGLAAAPAVASPTGLNNIPTADVVPTHVLVLQGWVNFGGDTDWFGGFKYGPAENWEVGLDSIFTGPGTGPTLQAKYRLPLANGTRVAAGVANVSNDRDRHGEFFPYVVATAPLNAGHTANGTVGYAFQSGNQGLFVGADYWVSPQLDLRADWTQTDSGDESTSSLGFLLPVTKRFLVESWASFPTAAGAETNYVVKVDYVIPLR
jgi:hypothetical protein